MAALLVFLQQDDGKLLKSSRVAISAAQQLSKAWGNETLIGLCLGPKSSIAAQEAALCGLKEVLWSEAVELQKYLASPYAEAVVQVCKSTSANVVVGASTSSGKDFLPRVAALLSAGQASEVLAINPDGSLKRPMYAGNVLADVVLQSDNKVVTIRTTSFLPAVSSATPCPIREISFSNLSSLGSEVVSFEKSGGARPELGDAEIVVSGGRALQSSENFEKFIFPLADALGAAVGASRAAVDSGYAPNDWQVGQTGKVVAPTVYFAVGISGAIQHLAGMKDSKTIVAINKDPDAPIFEVADYGLVADLFQAVPTLTELIRKAKGG